MKKSVLLVVTFFVVWALVAGACYSLNLLFRQNWFDDWHEYVVIGLAGALAAMFGPVLAAWFDKMLKKKL